MGEIQQGIDEKEDVLALLNEAYDDWGDLAYFDWKYDAYPDYAPEEHVFHTRIDGELAAFRRVFYKELVDGDRTTPVFVLGDTAVGLDYRGRGLYSDLHSRTLEFSARRNAAKAMTFNRKTNLTFKANLDRGWDYQELPLKMRIFSPDLVLEQYANLVIDDLPVVDSAVKLIGDRIHVNTTTGTVRLSDFVDSGTRTGPMTTRSVGPTLSDRTVVRLVERVSNREISGIADRPFEILASRSIWNGRFARAESPERRPSETTCQVTRQRSVSESTFEELVDLYDPNDPSFRRTGADIRHIVRYPDRDVLLARRDGELLGYAVLGTRSNGPVLEGRVLEIRAERDGVFDALIDEAERTAIDRGCDLLIVLSEREMGELWAAIDQQVMMWTDLDSASNGSMDAYRVSLYDIV
jgi:GNAT superfamily N-acetyltransferase